MTNISDPAKSFQLTIKTLYDIEKQLEIALPKMAEAAANEELVAGFEEHLKQTEDHSQRLEEIFEIIGAQPEKHAADAIRGLIADGRQIISTDAPAALKDALLAGAGRDVEHYEMACYMNAIEEARGLGLTEAVDLLEETLGEEKEADQKLTAAVKDNLKVAKEA
jgi:ferritin-like metal-binding protein YciE